MNPLSGLKSIEFVFQSYAQCAESLPRQTPGLLLLQKANVGFDLTGIQHFMLLVGNLLVLLQLRRRVSLFQSARVIKFRTMENGE